MTEVPQRSGTWVTETAALRARDCSVDGILRMVVGIALLALVFVFEGSVRWLGLMGLVPLTTGLFAVCPAYALFSLSTCPVEAKRA